MPVDIVAPLRIWSRASASALRERLGVSPPTLMRAARMAGDAVIVRGSARRSTYAARRALRGSMDPIPVYRIDERGVAHEQAHLSLIYPDDSVLDLHDPLEWPILGADMADGWHDGLPYPLQDMRPQGFLGRHFARNNAGILQVDEDPTRWSDDDALHALTLLGDDAPGNFILGQEAFRRWLESVQAPLEPVDSDQVSTRYVELAARALRHGVAGSSAGGEFPKFTTLRRFGHHEAVSHVLVKFSGNDAAEGTRRWADLLVCEHLAAHVLRTGLGVRAADSALHRAGDRTFLEVVRFDRHDRHGRSGLVSLQSVSAAFLGTHQAPWPVTVEKLANLGLLPASALDEVTLLWHFGRLIGNTDMHEGNLSFQATPTSPIRLRVAPAYDMLPMMYAPARGVEVVERPFEPQLPLPGQARAWRMAAKAAVEFWGLCASDNRISRGFRKICGQNARAVEAALKHPTVAS